MGSRRIPHLIAAVVAVVLFGLASPARASMTIGINPGNLIGKPAGQWGTQECSAQLGGGPYAGKDVWIFNLPGNHDTTGDFLSLTITFSTPGGDVVRTIPGTDSGIVLLGHSKAWIAVPAGWTLKAATAVISGTADQFVLTHTCPAGGTNPGPSSSTGTGDGGGGDGGGGGNGDGGGDDDGGPLPTTGTAITGLIAAGSLISTAGAALIYFVQRRRRIDFDGDDNP